MIHRKALAVVVAYDMYLECAEGDLAPAWKMEKPMDFWSFREKKSEQMLQYKPTRRKYPGDGNMRAGTQQSQKERKEKAKERNDQSILDMTQGDPEVDANNPIYQRILRELLAGVGNPDCAGTCPISSAMLKVCRLGRSIHCPVKCVASSVIQCVDCATSSFTFSQTEARIWGRVASLSIIMIASLAWLWRIAR